MKKDNSIVASPQLVLFMAEEEDKIQKEALKKQIQSQQKDLELKEHISKENEDDLNDDLNEVQEIEKKEEYNENEEEYTEKKHNNGDIDNFENNEDEDDVLDGLGASEIKSKNTKTLNAKEKEKQSLKEEVNKEEVDIIEDEINLVKPKKKTGFFEFVILFGFILAMIIGIGVFLGFIDLESFWEIPKTNKQNTTLNKSNQNINKQLAKKIVPIESKKPEIKKPKYKQSDFEELNRKMKRIKQEVQLEPKQQQVRIISSNKKNINQDHQKLSSNKQNKSMMIKQICIAKINPLLNKYAIADGEALLSKNTITSKRIEVEQKTKKASFEDINFDFVKVINTDFYVIKQQLLSQYDCRIVKE